MKTFKELGSMIAAIETDAGYYKGDMPPRVVAAYSEAWSTPPHRVDMFEHDVGRPPFVFVDVQYHSKGYRALYEIDVRTGAFVVAQD